VCCNKQLLSSSTPLQLLLGAVDNRCRTVCLLASAAQAKRVAQWRQDQQAAATAAAQVMHALPIDYTAQCLKLALLQSCSAYALPHIACSSKSELRRQSLICSSFTVFSMICMVQVQQQQLAEWWAQRCPAVTSTISSSSSSGSSSSSNNSSLCSEAPTACTATAFNTAADSINANGNSSNSNSSNASSTTLAELESVLQQKCGSCREHLAQQQALQLAATDAVECSAMPSMLAQAAAAAGGASPEVSHTVLSC
jgi:hypothetical protein